MKRTWKISRRIMPFGAPYDGIWREGPGFAKHATDDVAQLSYMQQRYYDPVSMRFLSPDPMAADADSFNVYAYANNNPYTFVDPDGRAACPKKSGGSCIDSPRTESGKTRQAGPSVQQLAVDSQVKAASDNGRLSTGAELNLESSEQGFKASGNESSSNPMQPICQRCSDGSTREGGIFNAKNLSAEESDGHTHHNGLAGLPGPEDGGLARVTNKSAYVISKRGAFAIERTEVGYRIRVIDGAKPTRSERASMKKTIDNWNQHSGGSGVSCETTQGGC